MNLSVKSKLPLKETFSLVMFEWRFLIKDLGDIWKIALSATVVYYLTIRHVARKHHIVSIVCLQMDWVVFIITFYFLMKYFALILAFLNFIYCPIVGNYPNFKMYWFQAEQSQNIINAPMRHILQYIQS